MSFYQVTISSVHFGYEVIYIHLKIYLPSMTSKMQSLSIPCHAWPSFHFESTGNTTPPLFLRMTSNYFFVDWWIALDWGVEEHKQYSVRQPPTFCFSTFYLTSTRFILWTPDYLLQSTFYNTAFISTHPSIHPLVGWN
jgi:hypothetical protein